jgi:hypothetical protein
LFNHRVGRRQFLKVSSASAIAVAVLGPDIFAEEMQVPQRLAVGFASFGDTFSSASSIPASDGTFIGRGARITLSGASRPAGAPAGRRMTELITHFSYLDGARTKSAPFIAWVCSRVEGCQGGNSSFYVPVDETQKLSFTVGVEGGTAVAAKTTRRRAVGGDASQHRAASVPLTLSLQEEKGSVRLARGHYVILPVFEGDSEPRWGDWSIGSVDGRVQLVDRNGQPAPFEHFVLKTDYASR